ncbi:MAG TPA: DUF192 domain-containing protein [Steroidobacteraceae bacterium]|nr:DUF192 domain-containing protein [Steroidobacteraceae bacterium]HQX46691.1 DUF192 domain-containing protein [Steroidobacteraceae bacterium]HQX77181.1 DUF192 domain-containing protein [Steroidobacteraceae bacterium]HQZ79808.1 DUF192 domain-containing protein [Steroidobacteraceae bacterium]
MMNNHLAARFALGALLLTAAALAHGEPPLEDLTNFPRAKLEISGKGGTQHFDVWVADTPPRQAQGLMFVRDLAPDAGMLFQSQAPRVMSMWMKNTYIPLDMLFIDAKGRVVHIAAQTKPHSLDTISSNEPVTMVLELRGGEAGKREIAVGDRVRASPDKP